MRFLFLQHVPFETPGKILDYVRDRGFEYSFVRFFEGDRLPSPQDNDVIVVMGGPMNIYEYDEYPWLREEKVFLKNVIEAGKKVLGICLGAQLIADVMGGKVVRNREKEIGWFEVMLTEEGKQSPLFKGFPERFMAFHWHGDMFTIPEGAVRLAYSEGCDNQAFSYEDRVVALQFHFETTPDLAANLVKFSGDDLKGGGRFVQSPEEIVSGNFREINKLLEIFLNNFTEA